MEQSAKKNRISEEGNFSAKETTERAKESESVSGPGKLPSDRDCLLRRERKKRCRKEGQSRHEENERKWETVSLFPIRSLWEGVEDLDREWPHLSPCHRITAIPTALGYLDLQILIVFRRGFLLIACHPLEKKNFSRKVNRIGNLRGARPRHALSGHSKNSRDNRCFHEMSLNGPIGRRMK